MVPVYQVNDLTVEGPSVERELAIFNVIGLGEIRAEAMRTAEIYRAKVVDSTIDSYTFELTGKSTKIYAFAEMMRPLGLKEIARTGVIALKRE